MLETLHSRASNNASWHYKDFRILSLGWFLEFLFLKISVPKGGGGGAN